MKNKWKTAFWIQFIVFVIITLFLSYSVLDQGVTITYLLEGYNDTENDLQQIIQPIKGKLTKADFSDILKRFPENDSLQEIELNRIKIKFDSNDKVDLITTKW